MVQRSGSGGGFNIEAMTMLLSACTFGIRSKSTLNLLLATSLIGAVGCQGFPRSKNSLATVTPEAPATVQESIDDHSFQRPKAKPISPKLRRLKDQYNGLTVSQAQELANEQGRRFRIGCRDGKWLPLTADFSATRITAEVQDGVVVDVFLMH